MSLFLYTVNHGFAGKMKIVEEPNTFGFVKQNHICHSVHRVDCCIFLTHFLCVSVFSLNNPFLAQGSRLQPKVTPFPVSGKIVPHDLKPIFYLIMCFKCHEGSELIS